MALNYTVPAVDRAIRVLELLSAAPHGMSLAQLAVQTKVPKSTDVPDSPHAARTLGYY